MRLRPREWRGGVRERVRRSRFSGYLAAPALLGVRTVATAHVRKDAEEIRL